MSHTRINYLDGLRGVAILLVLAFHAYSRWATIMPYGDTYEMFPVFKMGWLGVQLFFLISGYVIFMTLDKSASFKVYLFKRWVRLFPAMCLAAILIYLSAPMFSERPAGAPALIALLPALTFIEPEWWSAILGIEILHLEGAFWSIYVEFKFYIIAGAVYFIFGRQYLVPSLVLLFASSILIASMSANVNVGGIQLAQQLNEALSLEYFGWFAAGASFYSYNQTKNEKWFIFALCICLVSSLYVRELRVPPAIAASMLSVFFAFTLKSTTIQKILTNKILLFFGFISYPLYLMHENAMVSMIIKSPAYLPWLPSFFYPFIAVALLSAVAYMIAKKYEVIIRRKIYAHSALLSPNKT